MENLVVQIKAVPVNMSKENQTKLKEVMKSLEELGYKVEPINCGECYEDDVLLVIHDCEYLLED
jgi:hypothetical protein